MQDEGTEGLEPGSFDTVVCLSVSKWVHLNGGDEALQALFARVWRLLAPGGRFLLEPQPWRSYLAAVHKQGRAAPRPVRACVATCCCSNPCTHARAALPASCLTDVEYTVLLNILCLYGLQC